MNIYVKLNFPHVEVRDNELSQITGVVKIKSIKLKKILDLKLLKIHLFDVK